MGIERCPSCGGHMVSLTGGNYCSFCDITPKDTTPAAIRNEALEEAAVEFEKASVEQGILGNRMSEASRLGCYAEAYALRKAALFVRALKT